MKKFFFSFILALLFVGCADKSISNVYKSENNQYIINSIPLDYKVSILGYKSKFHNNLLLASVDVQNNNLTSYDLEYRFRWYDESGFEISKTPWLPLTLNAREMRSIEQIATSPNAESFKFYIRVKQ